MTKDNNYVYRTYTVIEPNEYGVDFEELAEQVKDAKDEATSKGWTELSVGISSTSDGYDGLGPVEINIYGRRKKTEEELLSDQERFKVEEYAKELGVSYYEASIILKLKSVGKL